MKTETNTPKTNVSMSNDDPSPAACSAILWHDGPGTAEGWKGSIAMALQDHRGKLITSPLEVEITLYFSRPKGHYGTGRNAAKLKPSAPEYHLRKPDGDNCAKAILDALSEKSGIGLWKDDTQVVDLIVRKRWATENRSAGAQIDIYEISGHGGQRPLKGSHSQPKMPKQKTLF